VVFQPAPAQFGDRDRLEAQCGRSTDGELGVDLSGKLPGHLTLRADAGAVALTVFVVAEVPDATAQVALDLRWTPLSRPKKGRP